MSRSPFVHLVVAVLLASPAHADAAAHELGHFILGSPAHAKSGVMEATFEGAHRLLQASAPLQLDRDTQARLRERLDEAASCP